MFEFKLVGLNAASLLVGLEVGLDGGRGVVQVMGREVVGHAGGGGRKIVCISVFWN